MRFIPIIILSLFCPLAAYQQPSGLRGELLKHYSGDRQKQQAVEWLFDNMPYHGTVRSTLQDCYYSRLTDIEERYEYPQCEKLIYSLADSLRSLAMADYRPVSDAETLTFDYLAASIDQAFDRWRNGNFARHLSFGEFCEYLLPYRLTNENITEWRTDFYSRYKRGMESLQPIDDKKYSAYWAASQVNDLLKTEKIHIRTLPRPGGVNLPATVLGKMRMGDCSDYALRAAMVMRACGIPVSVDFTPQWPTRPHGHQWNVVHDNSGRNIPFMGSESNPGYPCKSDYVYGKVYRYTYSYQEESLYHRNRDIGETLPEPFRTPFIKDVTEEYTKGTTVEVTLEETDRHFAYLAAFNNQGWTPIAWAEVERDDVSGGHKCRARFHGVGRGAVYLPVLWDTDSTTGREACRQAGYPILVSENGDKTNLKPDMGRRRSLTLTRKYPKYAVTHVYSKRMVGGVFHASSSYLFTDAVKVAEITRNPDMEYDSVEAALGGREYRYIRYTAPRRSHCNVAELEFLDATGKKLVPLSIDTDGNEDAGFNAGYAFDGDALTYYHTKKSDDCTITIDFGKPVRVSRIRYLPRNDDNHVTPGHRYRLDYYDRYGVHTAGEQIATTDSVTFSGVPIGALLILHDLTKGREERIFTCDSGEVRWY